ncbi:MAG: carboxypeptidase-like regulatory domain-containing protein [Bacteroidales bacterium]|nr:carboxypeptidase-like regulatory domain-containing protein [Bacteroidales bacterium]
MNALAEITRKSLRYGALIIALLISASAIGQGTTHYTVSGVIKDSKTKTRVVFSNISVPGTNIGTVANSDGEFTLKIPTSLNIKEFEISHLGYQNKKFSISETSTTPETYLIDPASVELKGAIVRPEDPRKIVQSAIDKISDNYSDTPNALIGFYRETIKQRRDYIMIAEAVAEIYKSPYNFTLESDKVKILKGRKSSNVKKADTLMVKMQGGPHVSLYLDVAKHSDIILSHQEMENYAYELTDIVYMNGETTYVITFHPQAKTDYPLYHGKLYISVESLAVTMAEFELDLTDVDKATQIFVRKKPKGLRFEPQSTNYMVSYKKQGDKYYLNYMRNEIKFRADWRRRIFETTYTVMSEMVITERNAENVSKIPSKETFRPYAVLADRVNDYFDENYWGAYNTIEPDESIQTAIKKFNRRFKKQ